MTRDEFFELTCEADYSDEAKLAIENAPKEWINELGQSFNWDCDAELFLKDVCLHPDCTLRTAVYIFLQGQPGYYISSGVSEWNKNTVEFLSWLHDRINSGVFKPCIDEGTLSHDMGIVFDADLDKLRAKDSDSVPISVGAASFLVGLDPNVVSDEVLGLPEDRMRRKEQQDKYVSIASKQMAARNRSFFGKIKARLGFGK